MSAADELAGSNVLVTGATGFIGSRLCERLLRGGAHVTAVSRSERRDDAGVRWWRGDLAEAKPARTDRECPRIGRFVLTGLLVTLARLA